MHILEWEKSKGIFLRGQRTPMSSLWSQNRLGWELGHWVRLVSLPTHPSWLQLISPTPDPKLLSFVAYGTKGGRKCYICDNIHVYTGAISLFLISQLTSALSEFQLVAHHHSFLCTPAIRADGAKLVVPAHFDSTLVHWLAVQ